MFTFATMLPNKDPIFIPNQPLNFFQKTILRFIRDERDLPFIYLCLKITFLVIPVAVYLFIPGCFNWWVASALLLINMIFGLGPFLLMLHNTSHRKLFKKKYGIFNFYIPYVLGLFYGESPETYFHHHIAMHHVENNIPPDISSTMHYRRDSIGAFMIYFFKFFLYGILDLSIYFKRMKRYAFLRKTMVGEISFILLCTVLAILNWRATLMVFILPFFISRFLMMAGNWAQHAFIGRDNPASPFLNSISCINCSYNKRCFNDGYHIGHHLRPGLHWTEMPTDFVKNIKRYAEEKAVVFQGIDYFYIWAMLMFKNYRKLADHYVDIDNSYKNRNDIIAFLKSRTQKFPLAA